MTNPAAPRLTDRRLHLVRMSANGHTDQRMADLLGISVNTVRSEIRSARRALGARDRAHAVAVAMVRGLIVPREIDMPQPVPGQPPGAAVCGMPHRTYPDSVCREPAGHDKPPRPSPHAAVLVIDGRECGSVAWDADTTDRKETDQ